MRWQRQIVASVLVDEVVPKDDMRYLFKVFLLVHTDDAVVKMLGQGVGDTYVAEDKIGRRLALEELPVVARDDHDAEVLAPESNIYVQQRLFGDPWHTQRSPNMHYRIDIQISLQPLWGDRILSLRYIR